MNRSSIRTLQAQLLVKGYDPGDIDGKIGARTRTAIALALEEFNPDTEPGWRSWTVARRDVLCLQVLCRDAGLDAGKRDGLWGPQTEYACKQLAHFQNTGVLPPPWRDSRTVPANPNGWPLERLGDLKAFYGPPGENLIMLELPYPLRLSWDTGTSVTRTQCNAKVGDSLSRVLNQVHREYGIALIRELRLDLYGGGFNIRDKRGGTTMSTHAFGIAFDFDPARNKLEWSRDRASFARPEYDTWWRCWEAEGWVSLGRARNFDWMHIQAARV